MAAPVDCMSKFWKGRYSLHVIRREWLRIETTDHCIKRCLIELMRSCFRFSSACAVIHWRPPVFVPSNRVAVRIFGRVNSVGGFIEV
jgi:hypothetical protein